MKLTQVLFEWVLTSAFLILAVTALRALLGKRVSAGLRYALWAVVLIRLLVPVQLFTTPVVGTSVMRETGVEQFVAPPPADFTPAPIQSFTLPEPTELPDGVIINYQPTPANITVKVEPLPVLQILGWLWLAGSITMGVAFVASNAGFARRLRRVRQPLEGADCPLPVYIAPSLPSPCLFGLARPGVYVTPETAADPVMLRHVLTHEHTHFRHGDHVWNILRSIALAIHWWNPLVWLAVILSRRDCELACDEGALKRLGDGERAAYGRTLLALLTVKPRPGDLLSCATTMTGGQKSVFERVTRIAHAPKRWLWAAAVAVLAAALACVCAFGQAAEQAEDDPSPSPNASPAVEESDLLTDLYLPRLCGAVFYSVDEGKMLTLKDVVDPDNIGFEITRYMVMDMDGDGAEELFLWFEQQGSNYLIFHEIDGTLYGYRHGYVNMADIRTDGTFYMRSVELGYGIGVGYATASFTKAGIEHTPFTYDLTLPSREDGLSHSVIVVDGQPADYQAYSHAQEQQEQKKLATWLPWNEHSAPGVIQWLKDAGAVWPGPADPFPAVSAQPTAFGGNFDFEVYSVNMNMPCRFSDLTRAYVSPANEFNFRVERYVLLDLDQNGSAELVLELEGQGGFIVLYRTAAGLYAQSQVPRGMMDLKADGTYQGSSGVGDWGYYAVEEFTTYYMGEVRFTWCESVHEDGTFVGELYFVDGAPATQREFEAASDAQSQKEPAPWQPWEEDAPAEVIQWLEEAGAVWLEPVERPELVGGQAGEYNWQLSYQGKHVWFTGGESWYGSDLPTPRLMDVNGDGREEIMVTMVEEVNFAPTERLYLFDAETLTQYDTSRTAAMVRSRLYTSCDETYFYLSSPEFGFYEAVPRGLAPDMGDKTRDYLDFSTFVYFPVRDDGRLACMLSTPVGKVYGILDLDGWNVTCIGFEYEEYNRPVEQTTYADVLIWGVPFGHMVDGLYRERVSAADIPALFSTGDPYVKVWNFAVVDLDGDGVDEVVLHASGAGGSSGGYLVLCHFGGGIVGFTSDWRNFWDLKTDGTFSWSSPTGQENGWASYPNLYAGGMEELSRMTSSWGEPDAAFSIGGESVTQEEYWEYNERQKAKPDVEWHEFTRENIEAMLLF